MKVVASYPRAAAANSARIVLESSGIRVIVLDHSAPKYPYVGIAGRFLTGSVKVAVADEDVERAVRILKTAAPTRRCPSCDSENTGRPDTPVYWELILFALSIGILRPKRRCNDCLHEWRTKKAPVSGG